MEIQTFKETFKKRREKKLNNSRIRKYLCNHQIYLCNHQILNNENRKEINWISRKYTFNKFKGENISRILTWLNFIIIVVVVIQRISWIKIEDFRENALKMINK